MTRMFFFGSLMDRELLAVVLQRDVADLVFTEAVLLGFERRRARGESFPIIVPHPGGEVSGFLVDGLNGADLDRIQFYEADDYALQAFKIDIPDGRLDAHVFLPTDSLEDEGVIWDFHRWTAEERQMCRFLAEELMSHYGILSSSECEILWPEMKKKAQARLRREAARRRYVAGAD